jgi:hypothetical protein
MERKNVMKSDVLEYVFSVYIILFHTVVFRICQRKDISVTDDRELSHSH